MPAMAARACHFQVQEQFTSANMALSLCPMLNQGALEALHAHGSADLKSVYVSGEWTGTMNLTEPQAGSDVSASHLGEPSG
jgi:alkylation response protein AidB-like acyl-CoA dehydrogenase